MWVKRMCPIGMPVLCGIVKTILVCLSNGSAMSGGTCRRRQRACLEYVDALLAPLLEDFPMPPSCSPQSWRLPGRRRIYGISYRRTLEVPLLMRVRVYRWLEILKISDHGGVPKRGFGILRHGTPTPVGGIAEKKVVADRCAGDGPCDQRWSALQ